MKPSHILLLVLTVVISIFFRFYNLSSIPSSLSHDEVAIGYNAWSVLLTGKDEYGSKFPILFRSFEDYKLPGYIYMTSISERFFGLSEFAVRFPSALFGVLTVLVFYFMVLKMFKSLAKDSAPFALLSAFILAISPWHVNFSRAAFEANVSLFFVVLGFTTLFWALEKPLLYIFATIFFITSIYFYYTARIFTPIVLLIFAATNFKEILREKKIVILSMVLGIILALPLLSLSFNQGLSRINQVSIFNDKTLINPYSEEILREGGGFGSKLIFNRRIAYLQEFSDNYLKNFAPDFIFANGTGPIGLAYIWELPFFIYGLVKSFTLKTKTKWVILTWFVSAPLAAGFTVGQPNALRTLANVPALIIYISIGIYFFFSLNFIKKRNLIWSFALIFVIAFFVVRFYFLYFNYYPRFVALNWGDGTKQMIEYVNKNKRNYKNVYITGANWRPYIYYLFYSKYDPLSYQRSGSSSKVEDIYFGEADWDKGYGLNLEKNSLNSKKGKNLFIFTQKDLASQSNKGARIKIIRKINGKFLTPAFYAVEIF